MVVILALPDDLFRGFKGSVPLKKWKYWNVNYAMYTFVLLDAIKFAAFSEKPNVIVFICGEIFLMGVINLAGLPDVGNTAKTQNL